MAELRQNTWTLDQWYDQDIAGNVSYSGAGLLFTIGGKNEGGQLGQNNTTVISSPVQIPGTSWDMVTSQIGGDGLGQMGSIKTDGTVWVWGNNTSGALGQNSTVQYSSPVQIPGTTWASIEGKKSGFLSTKTDGTLWAWGANSYGILGQNNQVAYSSPIQIGSDTTWGIEDQHLAAGNSYVGAIKTDGTLWVWGYGASGRLGQNGPHSGSNVSSPVQIPGTTWASISFGNGSSYATKTDGTMWAWGDNPDGVTLGLGDSNKRSSPTQIPGTTWGTEYQELSSHGYGAACIRTDGTLWAWGYGSNGVLGQNGPTSQYDSPLQIPGTTWRSVAGQFHCMAATKTDGTFWAWGSNTYGALGQNNRTDYSSPRQVPGTTWGRIIGAAQNKCFFGTKLA